MSVPTATSAPRPPQPAGIDPDLRRLTVAVIVGAVAVILDTTIVSVGLHELGTALDASVATIQWVSTAYLLAMFVTIPLTGWLQSRLGSKRLWLIALSVFVLGSALCALAWDAPSLIAFRVVQGLGGGVLMPLMSTVLMQAAHGRDLGRLMAAVSLPVAVGPILGPVLGGLVLGFLSWHWLFLINVPIGAVGIWLAVRYFPAGEPGRPTRLDAVGLALLVPGVVATIYGLTQVAELGGFGHARVLVPLLGGLALVGGFVAWALREGERALIDVRLLRNRPLAASSLLMFLSGMVLYGAMLLLPLYWQEVRGYDALGAGLLLVPQGVGALASRTLAGRLTDAIGGRAVAVGGFAILTLGTLPFAFVGATSTTWLLLAVLVVRGFGLGAVMIPLMTGAYRGLDRRDMPDASIITRVSQQVGGSFGTAVLAVVLATAAGTAASLGDLADAFDAAFWWATGLAALATVLCVLLPGRTSDAVERAA
ncbi:MDR family MFS transporter [Luteimicrobium subarcticum]|uniref:EmrB/QacA subfamily drug resistance transporter n=1 Tax=Luteimicrobium subarcticum TaxID=620910 RepID=A0A2M8W6I7_9MICO|nr:MDR family MFS transporter [Luteimicrobium subarcticum]PJI86545.1 EmrB/QacA subfamily drug resistance transporter [Luteimicrobium subarcticum]